MAIADFVQTLIDDVNHAWLMIDEFQLNFFFVN